jgi:hypothetical protein
MLNYVYIGLIGLSFLIGLLTTWKSGQLSYQLLCLLLAITFINETLCFYIKLNKLGSTYIYYNIYYFLRFVLIGIIYNQLFETKWQKKIIMIFFLLSFAFLVYSFFYLNYFTELNTNYLLTGGIFTILCCLILFTNILRKSKTSNPLKQRFFLASTGFFFFFLGILPFYGIVTLLLRKHVIVTTQYLVLVKVMSVFLYLLISAEFILQWKIRKSNI